VTLKVLLGCGLEPASRNEYPDSARQVVDLSCKGDSLIALDWSAGVLAFYRNAMMYSGCIKFIENIDIIGIPMTIEYCGTPRNGYISSLGVKEVLVYGLDITLEYVAWIRHIVSLP
jgi:hypothetical protein